MRNKIKSLPSNGKRCKKIDARKGLFTKIWKKKIKVFQFLIKFRRENNLS